MADYKTDRVSLDQMELHAQRYEQQGRAYVEAVERTLRERCGFVAIYLRLGRAVELVEHGTLLVWLDADTGIRNRHRDLLTGHLGVDRHATRIRELDGIANEIEDHLTKPRAIAHHPGAGGWDPGVPFQPSFAGHLLPRKGSVEEDVAQVIALWTGIPVTRLLEGEKEKLLHMEQRLGLRVIGQDAAITAVSNAVRRARSGMSAERALSPRHRAERPPNGQSGGT